MSTKRKRGTARRRSPLVPIMLLFAAVLGGFLFYASPYNPFLNCPPNPPTGYSTYDVNGGVCRPSNAVDVFIVYSGGSSQYMPELIQRFNQSYVDGVHPVTGDNLSADDIPIYVWGTPPDEGPSSVGVTNAFVAPNNAVVYRPTILQPSASQWLALINDQTRREVFNLDTVQATALSPLVIAIWESHLDALRETLNTDEIGFQDLLTVLDAPRGWQDYGLSIDRRAVYYGHTNPAVSTTGLSAAITAYYTCARSNGFTDERLTRDAVSDERVQTCVRELQSMVRHYANSNRDFIEYIARGADYLDFLPLEESDLICLNTGGQQGDRQCIPPREPLVALYPSDGTLLHDYPFGIVNADWVTADQQQAAEVFTEFVLLPDSQREIMRYGFRPANADVELTDPFIAANGINPNQPTNILTLPETEALADIQRGWGLVKKRADILLLIDTSGSMNDDNKLNQAKEAALTFIAEMETTNRVALTTFSSQIYPRVQLNPLETNRDELEAGITRLNADGSTELYRGIAESVAYMEENGRPDRIRAIVLLSDGADTGDGGVTLDDAVDAIRRSQNDLNRVMLIPLAYGSNASVETLNYLADESATIMKSGDPRNIEDILRFISSYF